MLRFYSMAYEDWDDTISQCWTQWEIISDGIILDSEEWLLRITGFWSLFQAHPKAVADLTPPLLPFSISTNDRKINFKGSSLSLIFWQEMYIADCQSSPTDLPLFLEGNGQETGCKKEGDFWYSHSYRKVISNCTRCFNCPIFLKLILNFMGTICFP